MRNTKKLERSQCMDWTQKKTKKRSPFFVVVAIWNSVFPYGVPHPREGIHPSEGDQQDGMAEK